MTSPRMFTSHEIKIGAGNVRFDRDLNVGWQVTPSIGIVAKDVMRMALGLESMKEPLTRSVRQVMMPSIAQNFKVGGRPKWQPISPFTAEIRTLSGYSAAAPPLTRSGALKKAASSFSVWDIGNTSATVRKLPADVWYGAIHQEGYGGFGVFMSAAKKQLGPRANPIQVRKLAFALNDQARGGFGKVAGAAGIPQRRFIMFQEDDIDDIQEVFYQWLVEQTVLLGRFTR